MPSPWFRIRALLALLLFATGDSGTQVVDAVIFHSRPAPAEGPHYHAGTGCHAGHCDLGAPISSPPLANAPHFTMRIGPATTRSAPVMSADGPRTAIPAAPVGSRAPPARA